MDDDRQGCVFIAEDIDPEDVYRLSGTFSAHWQAADGPGHRPGPEGVSAAEAIAWGREQADVVQIRLGDSDVYHSAGSRHPEDHDMPVWPDGRVVSPRRWPGMEHLDLVAEEPIPWEVPLPRPVSRRNTDAEVEQLRGLLAADPAVEDLRVEVAKGDTVEAVFRFVVRARSHAEVLELVAEIERRTIDQVPFPWDELPHRGGAFYVIGGWDPNDIRPAPEQARSV